MSQQQKMALGALAAGAVAGYLYTTRRLIQVNLEMINERVYREPENNTPVAPPVDSDKVCTTPKKLCDVS